MAQLQADNTPHGCLALSSGSGYDDAVLSERSLRLLIRYLQGLFLGFLVFLRMRTLRQLRSHLLEQITKFNLAFLVLRIKYIHEQIFLVS